MSSIFQFSHSVVLDSVTPWTAARQASLSFTISQSLLKLMSIESVMTSTILILCHPLLLVPSVFSSIYIWMTLNWCSQPGPLPWIPGSYIQFSIWHLHQDVQWASQTRPPSSSCTRHFHPYILGPVDIIPMSAKYQLYFSKFTNQKPYSDPSLDTACNLTLIL